MFKIYCCFVRDGSKEESKSCQDEGRGTVAGGYLYLVLTSLGACADLNNFNKSYFN
jgi:hypothetical protein